MIAPASTQRPATLEELIGPALAARLDFLDLYSRKIFAGRLPGERRSKRRGRSVEFDDFRDYVPGDDLRHIDWNAYARLDRLLIKLFREEEDLGLHLIIDTSASMDAGEPSKLVFAHRLAMALAYIGVVNQNRVSVTTFGSGARRRLAAVRGKPAAARIGAFLLESLAGGGREAPAEDFNTSIRRTAADRSGRGVVIVLTDFLQEGSVVPALNALAAGEGASFDVYLLHILSPEELDPAKNARVISGDLRLSDIETARTVEVTVSSAMLRRYREKVDRWIAELRSLSAARGLAHFLVPSDTPVDTLVLDSLRRGGMLR